MQLGSEGHGRAQVMETVSPGPPASPEALRPAIEQAIARTGCVLVTGDVARIGLGVQVRGVAGAGGPAAALRSAIEEAAPGVLLDWQVATFQGPSCAAIDIARPFARSFAAPVPGIAVSINERQPLSDNVSIIPRIQLVDAPALLQVDYLTGDDNVTHMANAAEGVRPAPGGSVQTVGQPKPGFDGWVVGPPYGTDLIIAIASSMPLFAKPPPETERWSDYEPRLRAALEDAVRRGAKVWSAATVLETAPAGGADRGRVAQSAALDVPPPPEPRSATLTVRGEVLRERRAH
jgi:serine/threonine-protein kinase